MTGFWPYYWALVVCFLIYIIWFFKQYHDWLYYDVYRLGEREDKPCTPWHSSGAAGYVKRAVLSLWRGLKRLLN